jgi:hypothetical protein
MRRTQSVLVVCTLVAIVLGALAQLNAAGRTPVARALTSLTQAGGRVLSHSISSIPTRRAAAVRQVAEPQQAPQAASAAAKFIATVQTDQEDYPPNTQVLVTGSDWLAREVVELTFTEIATTPPGGYTDGPFVFYATSDAKGNIANGDFYTDQHDIGVTFQLTAKGMLSGRTAQTTFTDGIASLSQCANGNPLDSPACQAANQWVSGNLGASKSIYYEGDSIPYRLVMSGLAIGGTHTVTIEWDTTKSGKHALDYLTSFSRSVPTASPCAGVTPCTPVTTAAIPGDPQVTGNGVTPAPGNFTLYGGTDLTIGSYSNTNGDGYAGDKSTRITINFMASVANPVLAWGGHIATRLDWGAGTSAVAISGSPYHMRLIDVDGSGGNQDRSLSADAVIFPGSVTVIKQATPEGTTSFGFTASPSPLTSFSLVDDGTTKNTKTFNITTFTTYTIAESSIPTGWRLDSASCGVTSPNGGSHTISTATATIVMKEGENWTCTYNNSITTGTLKVIKHVVNENGGSASAGDWSLHVKSGTSEVSGSPQPGSETGSTYSLVGGAYNVSETGGLSGYTATFSGDCDSSGNVSVVAQLERTCTITNDDVAPHSDGERRLHGNEPRGRHRDVPQRDGGCELYAQRDRRTDGLHTGKF